MLPGLFLQRQAQQLYESRGGNPIYRYWYASSQLTQQDIANLEQEVIDTFGYGPHDIYGKVIKPGQTIAGGISTRSYTGIMVGNVISVNYKTDTVTIDLDKHPNDDLIGTRRTYMAEQRFLILD